MHIEIINTFKEIENYLEKVKQGKDINISWQEEVINPYWNKLCCYSPIDLNNRIPKPIISIEKLKEQYHLLLKLDLKALEKEFTDIANSFPNYDDDPLFVAIFPSDNNNQKVNELQNGVIGTSLFGNMYIEVNPLIEGYLDWTKYVFAHEYHHTVFGNYWYVINGGSLDNMFINSLLIDGEADSFALSIYPNLKPKWLFSLSNEEIDNLWNNTYIKLVNDINVDYVTYMFGNNDRNIPWCAGYAIGYMLVQKYLKLTNKNMKDIVEIKPIDIYKEISE